MRHLRPHKNAVCILELAVSFLHSQVTSSSKGQSKSFHYCLTHRKREDEIPEPLQSHSTQEAAGRMAAHTFSTWDSSMQRDAARSRWLHSTVHIFFTYEKNTLAFKILLFKVDSQTRYQLASS